MATFDELAPWQALEWFQTPIETLVVGAGAGTKLCGADPSRVLLAFSSGSGAGAVNVTTDPSTPLGKGLGITASVPSVVLNVEWYGPLVSMAWFCNLMNPSTITVFEVKLRDWPIPDRQWWDRYERSTP